MTQPPSKYTVLFLSFNPYFLPQKTLELPPKLPLFTFSRKKWIFFLQTSQIFYNISSENRTKSHIYYIVVHCTLDIYLVFIFQRLSNLFLQYYPTESPKHFKNPFFSWKTKQNKQSKFYLDAKSKQTGKIPPPSESNSSWLSFKCHAEVHILLHKDTQSIYCT